MLKGESPFHVMGIYDYANKQGDPQTMWHLIDKLFGVPEDEFIQYWFMGVSFLDNADRIDFSTQNMERVGDGYWATINISSIPSQDEEINMTLAKDGIWRMHQVWMEPLDSIHLEQVTEIDDAFMQRIQELYEKFASTHDELILNDVKGAEVIGLYYYAEELKDYGTQHALLVPNITNYGDKETYIQKTLENQKPFRKLSEDFTKISFRVNKGTDEIGYYLGNGVIGLKKVEYPWLEPREEFLMKDTEFGWRILLTPNH